MSAYVVSGPLAWVLIGFMFLGWLMVSVWFLVVARHGVDRLIERRMEAHRQRLQKP